MSKPLILTSPRGVAEYPYLTEPDVVFNPEGLFHTKLVCKQHDFDPKKKVKKAPLPYEIKDEDVTLNFKMKAQGVRKSDGKSFTQEPHLLNADLSEFDKTQTIWGGSILKITFEPYAWNMPIGIGCTLRLKAVQVLELITGKSSNNLGDLKAEPTVEPIIKEQPPEIC